MELANLLLITPEIFVLCMSLIVLMLGVITEDKAKVLLYAFSLITLIVGAYLTLRYSPNATQRIFAGSFIIDKFAMTMKVVLFIGLSLIWIYSREYIIARNMFTTEYFVLTILSLLGMMILVSSGNFLTLYLGMELLALPIYAMIVINSMRTSFNEAALKYFILGGLGAALILYGISLIYGVTGSLEFSALGMSQKMPLKYGMVFIIAGLLLEFGAVPFHMWLPDIYEGSPTSITVFIGTLPKVAVFAMAYRIFKEAFIGQVGDWFSLLLLVGLASIIFGNIVAIAQTNIKRMLAYSTISHIGFIILGIVAGPSIGYSAAMFYTITYALMSLAAFGMIIRLSKVGFECEELHDYAGLASRNPFLSAAMLLILLSLAGIPPLVGFYAKFIILDAMVKLGYYWVAIVALLSSVIGSFFYLRVIKIMYFDEKTPSQHHITTSGMSVTGQILITMNGLSLLLLGIFPGPIIYLCRLALQ